MGGNKLCDRLRLKVEIREQMAEHLDVCEDCRKE